MTIQLDFSKEWVGEMTEQEIFETIEYILLTNIRDEKLTIKQTESK